MWDVQKPSEVAVACGGDSKGTLWSVGRGVDGLPLSAGQWRRCLLSLASRSWLYAQGHRDSQWGIGRCHKEPSPLSVQTFGISVLIFQTH